MANFISKTWVSFVHDLDSNSRRGRNVNVVQWPKYSLEKPENFVSESIGRVGWRLILGVMEIDFINQNALAV